MIRASLAVYRVRAWWLFRCGLLVLVPTGVLEAVVDARIESADVATAIGELATLLPILALSGFGYQLIKGAVAQAAMRWRAHERRVGLFDVARQLPWVTLVVLDLVLTAGMAIGLELLLIPGIVFYTWFGLAPAVAEIEDVRVRAALRRSRELVRGNFWRVLVLQLAALGIYEGLKPAVAAALSQALPHAMFLGDRVRDEIAAGIVGAVTLPVAALLIVQATLSLIDAERAAG